MASRDLGVALTISVVAGAFALVPGPVRRPAYLRLLRLLAGGMSAVTGAVLIMQLDFMLGHPENQDARVTGATLMAALTLAAIGIWVSDRRFQLLRRQSSSDASNWRPNATPNVCACSTVVHPHRRGSGSASLPSWQSLRSSPDGDCRHG